MIATLAASFYGKSPLWLRHKIPKKTLTITTTAASKKKQKQKQKNKTKLNSTQLRASQLHPRAQFCNTVASDGCRTLMSVWRRIIFFLLRTFCWHLGLGRFLFVGVGGWVVIFFFLFFLIVLSKLCVNGKSWRGRQSWDESIDTDLHSSTGPASSSHAGPIHRLLSVHIMTSGFFVFLPNFVK
jgi:uncharacterized membrane protein YdbT with pleckstrin-like domain